MGSFSSKQPTAEERDRLFLERAASELKEWDEGAVAINDALREEGPPLRRSDVFETVRM